MTGNLFRGLISAHAPCFALIIVSLSLVSAEAGVLPRAQDFKLDNGLHVLISDRRAPVVTQMVWYKVGAADEPAGSSGIAHFLEHLMFKGTDKIPTGQFSKTIARNGGKSNAFTNHDATAYFQRVAKERLSLVMEMEADRMVNLRLTEEGVATERQVILEERRTRVDNKPNRLLQEQMMAVLYSNHPYGIPIIGWEHEIRQLSRQDALSFYRRFYAPNNAILVIAGDVEADEVRELAENIFGKLPPNNHINVRTRPREPERSAPLKVTLADPRVGRTTVQRFYIAPSYASAEPGEAEALDLLMRVAAAGSVSRLYKRLVISEKKAANAGGWYSHSALDSGRVGFYGIAAAGVSAEELEQAIDGVIADLRENGVSQEELDRARAAYLAGFAYSTDSIFSLARHYGNRFALGMSIKDIEEWPDRLKRVTVADLREVARKYLDRRNSVTGLLLPASEHAGSTTYGASVRPATLRASQSGEADAATEVEHDR